MELWRRKEVWLRRRMWVGPEDIYNRAVTRRGRCAYRELSRCPLTSPGVRGGGVTST